MIKTENNIDSDTLRGFLESPKIKKIICETQGEVFKYANDLTLDMDVFVPKYMKSRFCDKSMDTVYSPFQFAEAEECLYFILKEIKVPKLKSPGYDSSIMEWIGYMYRYLYYRLKTTSKEIIISVPFSSMMAYYSELHTMDADTAVDIIRRDML